MVKDHLGNVRMVLTDDVQTDHYPTATLEANALTAQQNYYDIGNHVVATPSAADGIAAPIFAAVLSSTNSVLSNKIKTVCV
jgi:hypothetical protein